MNKSEQEKMRALCFAQTKSALQKAITHDQLIMQANEMVRELHKTTNVLTKRMREWSGGWFPELDTKIKDHEQLVFLLANKSAQEIRTELGVKESVGTPIDARHESTIAQNAKIILSLYKEKESLEKYISKELHELMPSTTALCGPAIAAEILSYARGLQRLANLPSGTIQLLGAETALFRHLKNKKNKVPKHGVIFNHQLLQRAKKQDRGKVARALADKLAIAAKVDYFKGTPCGEELRKQIEEKFA